MKIAPSPSRNASYTSRRIAAFHDAEALAAPRASDLLRLGLVLGAVLLDAKVEAPGELPLVNLHLEMVARRAGVGPGALDLYALQATNAEEDRVVLRLEKVEVLGVGIPHPPTIDARRRLGIDTKVPLDPVDPPLMLSGEIGAQEETGDPAILSADNRRFHTSAHVGPPLTPKIVAGGPYLP
jgi:hypothetical protein